MELYIFNEAEKLINAITTDTNNGALIDDNYTQELNGSNTFEFKLSASMPASADIVEKNKVGFFDIDGHLQVFEIVDVEETHDDYQEKAVYCEHISYELLDAKRIRNARPTNATARQALTQALEITNWKVGEVADLGLASVNFYRLAPKEALQKIVQTWGGDLQFRLETDGQSITSRFVDLVRQGGNQGVGFEYGFNTTSVDKTTQIKQLKTAVYGYGQSEETDGDDFGHRISFADIEWSVADGDPVDKPLGQMWVGLPDALERNGRVQNGIRVHRFGDFEDSEEENPEMLLLKAYKALLLATEPVVNYKVSAVDYEQLVSQGEDFSHWKVRLGDTCFVIDREFKPALTVSTRVIKDVQHPFTDPGNRDFELGNFLEIYDDQDRLDDLERRVNDRIGQIDNPKVDPGDMFPDAPTAIPTNVKAKGLFQNIAVNWDMMQDNNIATYEVYGSQSPELLGNPESLVFRGFTSGFLFEGEQNRVYYFAVRSVNYHGRASALSTTTSAQTELIMTEDILFGPDLAEKLRELNKEADIIGSEGINLDQIANEVYDQIERDRKRYTDQEIAHVENALNQELRDRAKVEDVERELKQITNDVDAGKESLSKVAEELKGVEEHFTTEFEILETGLSGKISEAEVNRKLSDKVDTLTYNQRQTAIDASIEGFSASITNANTRINNVTNAVEAVEQRTVNLELTNEGFSTSIEEITSDLSSISASNLISNGDFENGVSSWGMYSANGNLERAVIDSQGGKALRLFWRGRETAGMYLSNNTFERDFRGTLRVGDKISVSLYIRSEGATRFRFELRGTGANGRSIASSHSVNIPSDQSWYKHTHTFTITNYFDHSDSPVSLAIGNINGDLVVSKIMAVYGPVPMEYSKSSRDIANSLDDKVDTSVYTARQTSLDVEIGRISGRVTSTESGIDGLTNTQSQFRQDLNGFSTSIQELKSNKVDLSTYTQRQTSLDATLNGITGRVSSTESGIDGLSSRTGELELSAERFNTSISELERLEVGGDNLARDVRDFNTSGHSGANITINKDTRVDEWNASEGTIRVRSSGGSSTTKNVLSLLSASNKIVGQAYTLSVWVKNNSSNVVYVNSNQSGQVIQGNEIGRFATTWVANETSHIQLQLRTNTATQSVDVVLWRLQLEEGNKMTGYKPPSNGMIDRISKSETSIDQNAREIEFRATQTSVDLVENRMSQAEGTIRAQADQIDLRVRRDGIVSAINITPESIRIDGNLIRITGQTVIDNAVIKSAHIESGAVGSLAIANASISRAKLQNAIITNAHIADATIQSAKIANVSADKINVGTIRGINITGVTITGSTIRSTDGSASMEVVGGNIKLTQSNGRTVEINPEGLTGYNAGGSLRFQANSTFVTSSALSTSFSNVYLASSNEARVVDQRDIPGDGAPSSYRYLPLRAEGFIGNYINVNTAGSSGVHLYLRPSNTGESRVTANGTTNSYRNLRASGFYGDFLEGNSATTGSILYVRADERVRATRSGTTGSYIGFQCSDIQARSLRINSEMAGTHFYLGTDAGELRVTNNSLADGNYRDIRARDYYSTSGRFTSTTTARLTANGGGRVFLHSTVEARVTRPGTNDGYINIRAADFIDSSSERFKTDIQRYEKDALAILNRSVIYSYFKHGNDYREYGFVTERETPSEIIRGDGVSTYSTVGIAVKAIQQLDTKVENVVDELSVLRIENQIMKKKIAELEGRVA